MKTVKFILPVVAVMVAVAGVFATGSSTPAENLVDVTAMNSGACTKDGTCDTEITTKLCKLVSGTQFKLRSGGACSGDQTLGAFVAIQPNNP